MATGREIEAATEESTSREVIAGGIRIHYNEVGDGDPIIAIHGGGPGATSWSNFQGNIPALARDNRLLMFDMPGWGRSEYPRTPSSTSSSPGWAACSTISWRRSASRAPT